MNKKQIGFTLLASAIIFGVSSIPAADAQVSAAVEAQARINAQRAADAEAAFDLQNFGINPANNPYVQQKYNEAYAQGIGAPPPPTMPPIGQPGAPIAPGYNMNANLYRNTTLYNSSTYPYNTRSHWKKYTNRYLNFR